MNALFITLFILAWIVTLFLASWSFVSTGANQKNRLHKRLGGKLVKFAKKNNYLLVPDVSLNIDKGKVKVDFFLLGDKYCYCIMIMPRNGALVGFNEDAKWTLVNPTLRQEILDNPMYLCKDYANRLEQWLGEEYVTDGLDKIILPVVVIPDSLALDPNLKSEFNDCYMFRMKYACQGIENIEKRAKVFDFLPETVETIANRVYALSKGGNHKIA